MNTETRLLEADEEQFRLLVNCIKDYAIFMMDPTGLITSWNEGAQRIKGYAAEEVIGKHINIFYMEADILNGEPARNMAMAKEHGSFESEGWRVRKNGSLFWADVIFTAVYNGIGHHTGFAKITRDITERKKAEEQIIYLESLRKNADKAINELNETLEIKVKHRTEQLETAIKELEGFSYSVSHDLRSPLRAINGYASMLQEDYMGALDEEGKRFLSEIQAGAKKMGMLIDDLLAFFRLGKKLSSKRTVDMNEVVKAVLHEIGLAGKNRAEIIVHPLHSANADTTLMLLVMTNLLSNAIKYSAKKDKPVIEISSTVENGEVIYTIKDNGAGFEMAYSHKLFEVFQRLHSSEEFEGNGVGLAIVQRIIKKHEGRVWAEGKSGEGASFHFSLPDKQATI